MGSDGTAPLRIGNASGFYGDRFTAVREMPEGGPLDVLTGDYLAELTMLILGQSRTKDPGGGYATTFLRQMEDCLGLALDRGTKIVTNAGGLNPEGLAVRLGELARKLGLEVRIAHVEGDDLLSRAEELGLAGGGYGRPLTANAYLGAWGIAECLKSGADVVVTGRVTDASLVTGPAAAHFGWARDDWDVLAGAGDANIGVWARTDEQWRWLAHFLTPDRLKSLLPETRELTVTRHPLPRLRAVNFVIEGLLQEGVSASTRFDPQGKGLGEWLRSRVVDIPEGLL
jgi:hypothetical protein